MRCLNCNKETTKWGSRFKKYCNRKCDQEHRARIEKKLFYPRHCLICNSEFVPVQPKQCYCSCKCKYQADLKARSKKTGNKECKHCKKEFRPYTSLDKFCSANCRVNFQKSKRKRNWKPEKAERIKGKGNPCYRNGMYSAGTKRTNEGNALFMKNRDELRAQMIKDSGCLYCEICNDQSAKFEMHHIVYRSEKPKHEHLHNPRNLINLCVKCHNWLHQVKGRRDKIVEQRNLVELFGNDILNKTKSSNIR